MSNIINEQKNKLSKAQLNEFIQRFNESYDRGGADALKFIIETAKQIAVDNPNFAAYSAFTLHVVEAVRQRLAEAVTKQIHDQINPDAEEKIIRS